MRLAPFVVAVGIVALALLTLPGISEIRERLTSADPWCVAATAALSLLSMFGFATALWAVFGRVMPWRRAVVLGFAEQGANVLMPAGGLGGPALGVMVMRRAGVPAGLAVRRHAVHFLSTSAVGFGAVAVAGLLLSAGLLPRDVSLAAVLAPALAALAVIAAAVLLALRAGRSSGGSGSLARAVRFVRDGAESTLETLIRGDRLLVVGAVAYYALDVAALGAAFQGVGGGAPPIGVFVLAYTIGHAGALLPTPGGLGGTEGGLIGAFSLYGASPEIAAAAVLGYRVFQLGLPAVLGGACMMRIRRQLANGPPRAEVAARFTEERPER
ncbi:MAG: putative heme transporter [Thermoleophilaceae bacterium]|jgi:uncharacterized membrane protein YbhN (UPF0104 family)|nr:putative heme transporter [Thermoleophilaceae bacterium]